MYEVELKVEADHEQVRDRLKHLEADRIEFVTQEDCYYDAPDREFAETDEALRIRTERSDGETETRLTYKGPLLEAKSKTREEAETVVADSDELEAILDGLGYEPAAVVRKDRERFLLDGCTITLDSVENLGEFLEVELDVAENTQIDEARDRLVDVLDRLGLDADEQIRTSYLGLLLTKE